MKTRAATRARFGALAMVALAMVVPAMEVFTPVASAAPPPASLVAYDSIGPSVPGNVISLGFEATSSNEFGDLVQLAGGPHVLDSVTVEMSAWGCETGGGATCVTTPGATWTHPLTLKIYAVGGTAAAPTVGAQLMSVTQSAVIPFRPSAAPLDCGGGTQWFDGTNCWNGFAFPVTFSGLPAVNLPSQVIWTIQYNTSHHGYTPIGGSCTDNCAYDSLNVGAHTLAGAPFAGHDMDPDDAVWSTSHVPFYCDPLTPANALVVDCGWTGNTPMATIVTKPGTYAASTQKVDRLTAALPPTATSWNAWQENSPEHALVGTFVTGPGTPPLGNGSLELSVAAPADGRSVRTFAYNTTNLSDVQTLSYSAYSNTPMSGNPSVAVMPSLFLDVNLTGGTSYQNRLVYEPIYSGLNPALGTWNTFDALAGRWWSSNATFQAQCPPSSGACTWAEILQKWPNAKLLYNVGSQLGSGLGSGTVNVDNITIGAANAVTGNITETTFDFENTCSTVCYVSPTGSDLNDGSLASPLRHIQTAVNTVDVNGTVNVLAGTYDENVTIGKKVTLQGPAVGTATVSAPMGNTGAAIQIDAGGAGTIIDRLTITRAGNDISTWNSSLATFGIVSYAANVTVSNNTFHGNRSALDLRPATGDVIQNNVISDNRTGVIIWGSAVGMTFTGNDVSNNWTIGVLFKDDPYVDASGAVFKGNSITGNWYAGVADTNSASSPKNFSGNWFGTTSPDVAFTPTYTYGGPVPIAGEPGYSSQIPTAFGGSAVPPVSPKGDLVMVSASNFDFTPLLESGTDSSAATGFQGLTNSLKVTPSGIQVNTLAPAGTLGRVQEAVDLVDVGGTIHVAIGSFVDRVKINKALSLLGAGIDLSTIIGRREAAADSAIYVNSPNVLIDGFTVKREGNTLALWNDPGLTTAGLAIQSVNGPVEVRNSKFQFNRTGIDINNASGANIHNNVISQNRTGMIMRNATDNMTVTQNSITDNTTVGVLFLDASGGTNSPPQSANGSAFNGNDISGNWYGQIVDRQTGGSLPAPGGLLKDFSGNWLGTTAPVVTTANSAEPGYAGQIPSWAGGSASAPGGQPDIAGPASANVDFTPMLESSTDLLPSTPGFQGKTDNVTVTAAGAQVGSVLRLQEGVNLVDVAGTVHVASGTYPQASAVVVGKSISILGPNALISPNNSVTPSNPNASRVAEATIHVTGTNLAIAVAAPSVTISGLRFTDAGGAGFAQANIPMIGAGNVNPSGGYSPNLTITNNIFDAITRNAVYLNHSLPTDVAHVDDNRVNNATSNSTCAGACGRTLFNLWKTDHLTFNRNVVVAPAGDPTRTRTLSVSTDVDTPGGVEIANNVQLYGCNFTCYSLAGAVSNVHIHDNTAVVGVGNIVQLYHASSPVDDAGQWVGHDVVIDQNSFTDVGDKAIVVDTHASIATVSVVRNGLAGGAFRIDPLQPMTLNGVCNWYGNAGGPVPAQIVGPVTTSPFLTTSNLNGICGSPTSVTGVPQSHAVQVSWVAPVPPFGASPIKSYTATASPGGASCTTVDNSGALTCLVSGLTNGQPYTFTVTAKDSNDVVGPPSAPSAPITPIDVPGAPTAVLATPGVVSPGVGKVTLSWTPPSDTGGTPIIDYTATETGNALITCTVTGTTCDIGGLAPGTTYHFTVTARNSAGSGPASSPATAVTIANVPDAPTGVTGVSNDGAVTVSWTAPAGNGSPVTGYTVTSTPGSFTCATAGTSCQVTGLTNGTPYTFTVVATNAMGNSAPSAASASITPFHIVNATQVVSASSLGDWTWIQESPVDALKTPTFGNTPGGPVGTGTALIPTLGNPDATAIISHQFDGVKLADITSLEYSTYSHGTLDPAHDVAPTLGFDIWLDPPTNPVYQGRLVYVPSNVQPGWNTWSPTSDPTPRWWITRAHLPADTCDLAHLCTWSTILSLYPNAAVGNPDGSAPGNVVIKAGQSSAPSPYAGFSFEADGLKVGVRNGGTITNTTIDFANDVPNAPTGLAGTRADGAVALTWTPPYDNGLAIDGYTVTAAPGGATCTSPASPTPGCTVSGLTNGTAYTFTVTAHNSAGNSQPSTGVIVTPSTVPTAPLSVTAVPHDGSVSVTWNAPASNGGATISGYTVTGTPGGTCSTSGPAPALTCDVTGLTNGTPYTFTVTATNVAGTGPASIASAPVTPATVPAPPTGVTANPGNGQAGVSWTLSASNGGSAITGYTVTSFAGVTPGPTCTTSGPVTNSCTVLGLTNGTAYTFSVVATNAIGNSAPSTASAPVTPFTTPGAPTGVTATSNEDQKTHVSWTAPASNGFSPIDSYTVTGAPGGTCTVTLPAALTCEISGLTNGTSYVFTVTAHNAAGNGPASAVSPAVVPARIPDAPTPAPTVVRGNGQVQVTWTAPPNGGSAITGYTVTTASGTPSTNTCTTTGALSCVVSGLTNGNSYTFTVHATNGVGNGPESAASASVTPTNVPTPPQNVSATRGDTQVTVAWTAPADIGGGAITQYTVSSSPGGATCATTGPTPALTCDVTGLTNGVLYEFTVTATNSVGDSLPSAPVTATPATTPSAPTLVVGVPGDGAVTVSWVAPATGGSPITGYTVTAAPDGATCTAVVTTCQVTGLTNGTAYTFTVKATNSVGTGPASAPSAAVTPTGLPAAPAAPTGVPGDGKVDLTWTAPANTGGTPITFYTVTATPGPGSCITPGTLTCTISGLTNGTPYTFTVKATNGDGTGPNSPASAPITPRTVPGVPTGVSANAGDATATVTWLAPASNGGAPITGYTVAPTAGAGSCIVTALSATCSGLTNGTGYTFTVKAVNAAGTGPGAESNSVTPELVVVGGPTVLDFTPAGPRRVFDTRSGESPDALRSVVKAKIGTGTVLEVKLTDLAGLVPAAGVGAVSLNVTVTNASNNGFVTVFPCGAQPFVSSVNFAPGVNVANAVIAPVSATGTVCFFANSPVDLIADVNGWFAADRAFVPAGPGRVFDTRPGQSANAVVAVPKVKLTGGTSMTVQMTGLTGLTPATGVGTVSLNVTVANPEGAGFITVYDCGTRLEVSSVNYGAGQTVANAVLAPVSASGTVCFFSQQTTDLIVDINGYFAVPSGFTGVSPLRVLDTRVGFSPNALRNVPKVKIGGSNVLEVKLTDLPGAVPASGVGAVSLNVTAVGPAADGFLTVYPCGTRPDSSSVNYSTGQTVANAVITPLSPTGTICIYSQNLTDVVVDVNGWFSDAPS